MAAHPSGRMLASGGRDKSLRLWDLTRGTSAANLSIGSSADALAWAPDGTHLAALGQRELTIVDARTAAVTSFKEKEGGAIRVSLSAMGFLRKDVVIVGDDRGGIR